MSWAAVAVGVGSAAGGYLSSQKGGSTNSQTNSAPWINQQGHLNNIYTRADQQQYLPTVAGQSPYTLQSQNMQAQRAMSGSPLNQAAQQQNLATLRGDYTDLSKNPAAQSAMNSARSQINSQFTGDNYGNSAHQEWLGKGLLNAASPFYESERQRQQGATALAPTLANQDYSDISQLGQAGASQDAYQQRVTDQPWDQLFRYQQALGTGSGGVSNTQQPYFTNPTASALGAGLGGLSLYNSMNQGGLLGGKNPNYAQNGNFSPQYGGYDYMGGPAYG